MSKHTPGPWRVEVSFDEDAAWSQKWPRIVSDSYEVVGTEGLYGDFDVDMANAGLIAAAPDNYECNVELAAIVRELCAAYGHPLPQASLDRSDAAIAKTRGEA